MSSVHCARSTPRQRRDLEDRTREICHRAALRRLSKSFRRRLAVRDGPADARHRARASSKPARRTEQIKEFFVSKYGEWVLLKPKTTGFSALLWILPYVVLVCGIIAALWFIRRWTTKKPPAEVPTSESVAANQAQREFVTGRFPVCPDIEDETERAQLLRGRGHVRDELNELEFDFQSGKLSEADYAQLQQEIESKGVNVLQQLSVAAPQRRK